MFYCFTRVWRRRTPITRHIPFAGAFSSVAPLSRSLVAKSSPQRAPHSYYSGGALGDALRCALFANQLSGVLHKGDYPCRFHAFAALGHDLQLGWLSSVARGGQLSSPIGACSANASAVAAVADHVRTRWARLHCTRGRAQA